MDLRKCESSSAFFCANKKTNQTHRVVRPRRGVWASQSQWDEKHKTIPCAGAIFILNLFNNKNGSDIWICGSANAVPHFFEQTKKRTQPAGWFDLEEVCEHRSPNGARSAKQYHAPETFLFWIYLTIKMDQIYGSAKNTKAIVRFFILL